MIDSMTRPRPAPAALDAHRRLGQHLLEAVRAQDTAIPADRRVPRTLQEMMPGYVRQPVLTFHRPSMRPAVMADDACGLCGRWGCDPSNCPPPSAAPAPALAGCDGQAVIA